MYLLKGSLPWQGLKVKNKQQKYDAIKNKKKNTSIECLCQGQPEEFATYLNTCRGLRFDEAPDYGYLRNLFKGLAARQGIQYDGMYDWLSQKPLLKSSLESTY